ncbi:hypothetical protein [Streptomyces coeruleorubidus]|uniref:SMI1/KNR4 family protein n=1 Tax=Streptomyces coeruleorubidus TaxID=116188 RepID=A0ABZ0KLX2_STRC4|nr:hypothetical protein [Streptomyces coeruleorubidus]WOT38596.1 hypothetical protein R5U08_32550 [Streptomyces coeruleorubidus]
MDEYERSEHQSGQDVDAALQELMSVSPNTPPDAAGAHLLQAERVYVRWHRDDYYLDGEFALKSLRSCLSGNYVTFEDSRLAEDQREVMRDLKIFEEAPGSGRMTGIRFPAGGTSESEIWFYDMNQLTLESLDIDYTTYLDTLLATGGVAGWQYLFADLDFRNDAFRGIAKDLGEMLSYFRQVFPDRDYEPLLHRLEARQ